MEKVEAAGIICSKECGFVRLMGAADSDFFIWKRCPETPAGTGRIAKLLMVQIFAEFVASAEEEIQSRVYLLNPLNFIGTQEKSHQKSLQKMKHLFDAWKMVAKKLMLPNLLTQAFCCAIIGSSAAKRAKRCEYIIRSGRMWAQAHWFLDGM